MGRVLPRRSPPRRGGEIREMPAHGERCGNPTMFPNLPPGVARARDTWQPSAHASRWQWASPCERVRVLEPTAWLGILSHPGFPKDPEDETDRNDCQFAVCRRAALSFLQAFYVFYSFSSVGRSRVAGERKSPQLLDTSKARLLLPVPTGTARKTAKEDFCHGISS